MRGRRQTEMKIRTGISPRSDRDTMGIYIFLQSLTHKIYCHQTIGTIEDKVGFTQYQGTINLALGDRYTTYTRSLWVYQLSMHHLYPNIAKGVPLLPGKRWWFLPGFNDRSLESLMLPGGFAGIPS